MRQFLRLFLSLLLFTGLQPELKAFNPGKPGTGYNGTGAGGNNNSNEIKLPVSLPLEFSDPPPSPSPAGNQPASQGSGSKIVYTFDLNDEIGPQSVHQAHSALQQARSMNAAYVLIHMNSYAGAMDAAMGIRDEILEYDRPVMMYFDNKAIPAGTLISLACDSVYMHRNAKTGSANSPSHLASKHFTDQKDQNNIQPVVNSPRLPGDANDRSVATATLPSNNSGYTADASSVEEVLEHAGLKNYTVVHYKAAFSDRLIDWLMQPWVNFALIVLLVFSMRRQQVSSFPGPATFLLMVLLPLFLIPLYMGGLANAGEIVLFLCVTLLFVFSGKKIRWLRFAAPLLLIFAFILCMTRNAGMNFSPVSMNLLRIILLSSLSFCAGWFAALLPGFNDSARRAHHFSPTP